MPLAVCGRVSVCIYTFCVCTIHQLLFFPSTLQPSRRAVPWVVSLSRWHHWCTCALSECWADLTQRCGDVAASCATNSPCLLQSIQWLSAMPTSQLPVLGLFDLMTLSRNPCNCVHRSDNSAVRVDNFGAAWRFHNLPCVLIYGQTGIFSCFALFLLMFDSHSCYIVLKRQ